MILDAILNILAGFVSVLLAPLEVINIGIDLISSIPVVASFIQVIAYIFPWTNILPIIFITIIILNFKLFISAIRAIWELLPFF